MRFANLLACSVAAVALAAPALAQDGAAAGDGAQRDRARQRRGQTQPLSAEKSKTAWTWQAKGVASDLSLDADATKKLVAAYVTSRQGHNEDLAMLRAAQREAAGGEGRGAGRGDGAGRGARGDGGGRGGDAAGGGGQGRGEGRGAGRGRGARGFGGGANPELIAASREKLAASLGTFLDETQAKKASAALGRFSTQWDRSVDVIVGFKLDDAKTLAALAPISAYNADMDKLREQMRAGGDRQGMREAMTDARQKLNDGLATVLTEEQMDQLEQATMRRGRGGRGGPGGNDANQRRQRDQRNIA